MELRIHNCGCMKKAFLGIVLVLIGASLFALGWISHSVADKGTGSHSSSDAATIGTATTNPDKKPLTPPPHPSLVSPIEWQRLRTARAAALQANPDLAAEYKQIIDDMQTEETKFDAAMIKADPKVAPIVAKLAALRQRNGPPPPR
jgi:hypothetical protein